MFDEHVIPLAWGIHPVLFNIGKINISSYSFFVTLGIIAGVVLYYWYARKQNKLGEKTFYLALAAFFGAAIGAKLPIWIMNFPLIIENIGNLPLLLGGRTILGGLIGGTIAVNITKKYIGVTEKRGNIFVPSIALGAAIGRIGCFLQGCCYGIATTLPWGINFGDGILRHPTQLYEIIFFMGFFLYAIKSIGKSAPGQLFENFILTYFTFRFFEEFLRQNSFFVFRLSIYQVISLTVVLYYTYKIYLKKQHGTITTGQ
jgi:phosphatidylglycerol:prolipoprotein diacylglycerol transferase